MFGKIGTHLREYLAPGQPAGYGQVTLAILAITWGMSQLQAAVTARREELLELGEQAEQIRSALSIVSPAPAVVGWDDAVATETVEA